MRCFSHLIKGIVLYTLLGCGTDLPTSGQNIWGRNEDQLGLVQIGSSLSEIVADPYRPYLYAADFNNSLLYIISSTSRQVEKRLGIGPRPSDLDISMDGSRLYVALLGGKKIAVIDLNLQEQIDTIPLVFHPGYLVTGKPPYIFVSSILEIAEGFGDEGEIYQINTATKIVDRVIPPVGLLEADPERSRLYISVHDRVYQYPHR